MDGLIITAECLERDVLEDIVTKLGELELIEIDIVEGKFVINHELDKLKKEVETYREIEALKAVEDKDWKLV